MQQIKQRINLLSESQFHELYTVPIFTKQDMELFFSLSEDSDVTVETLRSSIYSREGKIKDEVRHLMCYKAYCKIKKGVAYDKVQTNFT